jgi:tRNA U34 2-thiouridine synthase MnmA/TrmU
VVVRVELHVPTSVPEGQILALYDGERCVGGGEIVRTHRAFFEGEDREED